VSSHGMLVEVNASIHVDMKVRVRFANQELSTHPTVRHCRQLCSWFRIGLEFERTLLSEDIPEMTEALTSLLRSEIMG
jgi:hypothetical protein